MTCNNCGKPLPSGVSFCPSCNAPTPYNTTGQNLASPYDPTVAASYGNPPSAPDAGQSSPYGSSPNNYSSPPQSPYTAYGTPGSPPEPSYGGNTPYGNAQASPQNYYTPPAPPQQGPPSYGYGAPGYAPGMQPGGYGQGMQPKRRSKVGLIVGISLLVFVLLCGGIIALFAIIGRNAASTVNTAATSVASTSTSSATGNTTPGSTPTAVAPNSNLPTTADIVPSASQILSNPQMSSAVDNNYEPTKITSTFTPGQTAYLTFHENSQGKDGYIQVKWYMNGTLDSSRVLKHNGQNDRGYFQYSSADTGPVEAAMYWCTVQSCGDAQLAQVVTFTISNTSAVPSSNTGAYAVIEGNRRID